MVDETRKRLFVVLGMHRSGTSALTRALPAFGIDLGDRLMPAVEGDNDKGFWEDLDVNQLNEALLAALGADWHSVGPLPEADFERGDILALRTRGRDLLAGKTADCAAYGMKDPRICRLLPFWKPIFRDLNLETFYLLAIRNPLSVAHSLAVRNGLPKEQSFELWMQYMLEALSGTQGETRLCVDYDELMLDAPRQLKRLGRFLKLRSDEVAARDFAAQFLEERLRRARFFMGDLEAEVGSASEVCELYSLLRRAAIGDRPAMDSIGLNVADSLWFAKLNQASIHRNEA